MYSVTHNTYTYTILQSPREANGFAASQEIPRISRNPKIHYRTHKRPPRVPILGQPNPVHIRTFHLLKIRPNIIHPSKPRSAQWSLSLRFPHQDPIPPSPHPHAPHAQPISFFSIFSPAQHWVKSSTDRSLYSPYMPSQHRYNFTRFKVFFYILGYIGIRVLWSNF